MKKLYYRILIFAFISITAYGAENSQARAIAEFVKSDFFVECDKNLYIKQFDMGISYLYQLISDPQKIKSTLKESAVSEADKLNGIVYKAEYGLTYKGPMRQLSNNYQSKDWYDGNLSFFINILNKQGVWSAEANPNYSGKYLLFTCESLMYRAGGISADDLLTRTKDFLIIALDSIRKDLPNGIAFQYLSAANQFVKQARENAEMNIYMEKIQKTRMYSIDMLTSDAILDNKSGIDCSGKIERAINEINDFFANKEEKEMRSIQEGSDTKKSAIASDANKGNQHILLGTYFYKYNKSSYIEFKQDGNFLCNLKTSKGNLLIEGTYQFDGENIILLTAGGKTDRSKIEGDTITDAYSGESGHRFWSKQATCRSEATLDDHYMPLWPD